MKYASSYESQSMARAQAASVPVSLKQTAEVCRHIRNMPYKDAVSVLERAMSMEAPIPYTRFNRGGTGHRKGMGPGRYPVKASGYMLKLLKSAYANAGQKGLNLGSLVVKAAVAKQGPRVARYGRHRGRKAKRTHIEVVLLQTKAAEKQSARKPRASAKKADAPQAKEQAEKK